MSRPDARANLAALRPGDAATVTEVVADGPIAQRLCDLGFLPGTEVALLRRAPLGDPLCFSVRGTELCLRGSEAAQVLVAPAGSAKLS